VTFSRCLLLQFAFANRLDNAKLLSEAEAISLETTRVKPQPPRPGNGFLGAISGLSAAVLFGISTPLAKLLLPRIDPWPFAGLLYLGAGAGMAIIRLAQRASSHTARRQDRLRRRDLPLLLGIVIIGGGIGPVLMLIGLARVSGVAGSLLLNLEAVFTMALAVSLFGERLRSREGVAAVVVIVGALAVSYRPGGVAVEWGGVAAIAGACLAWGIDNNLTARLSVRDPLQIVLVKALGAGTGNLVLAAAAGQTMPTARLAGIAMVLGFVSYGVSIVLDVYALRYVGAAREAAFFATAPFAGALASMPLLGEVPARTEIIGGLVMAVGVVALMAAREA
jgi:drug/metabolite transporter (DMT)-like permease